MSSNNQYSIKVKDYLVSGESFTVGPHPKFEILQTTPQPAQEDLARYYESEDYISHTDSKKGLMSTVYQIVKTYSLSKKVKLITKLNKGHGTVLDIGAGTGDFLKVAKDVKWNVNGVEVNEQARMLAKQKGISLQQSIDDYEKEQFDVVTLWHVLEHLPDLEATVQKIENLVKPGGSLLIAVPNYKSYDATYYKEFWAAYDVPRHLWHFSKNGIRQIISNSFESIETKPMIFDSFYVSLLSEKNKSNNSFSLKALWKGLQSNIKAQTTKEYSSLIYCFKKSK